MTSSSPDIEVTGFAVVRRAGFDFSADENSFLPRRPPVINNLKYHGVERLNWEDIEDQFFEKRLPEGIEIKWKNILMENNDFTGLKVSKVLADAEALLEYSNGNDSRNELIVLASDKLSEIKGKVLISEAVVTWLGYDVFSFGDWSIIRNGVFASPESFSEWTSKINQFGLLDRPEGISSLVERYDEVSLMGHVEEIPESDVHAIRIGLIK